MAFQPSKKAKLLFRDYSEPDLVPLMNIMLILIPLLVSIVSFIQFAFLQYNPNPAAGGEGAGGGGGGSGEAGEMLNLVLNITENSFQISVLNALPGSPNYFEIPKLENGRYNYTGLKDRLMYIRKEIVKDPIETKETIDPLTRQISYTMRFRYADGNIINISAKNEIPWQVCTRVLDVIREYEVKTLPNGAKLSIPLFAEPVFGQIQ
ncbi:MAG: hypothetical protein N2450_05310 [bacterium]|nr:hypothetical protein [bacterium]